MASHCPHCKDRRLNPARIENDLPAMSCDGCGGSLLSLVAYRHWRESQPEHAVDDVAEYGLDEVKDTSIALCCPKCRHFMTKFRVSADAQNQIDLCVHCDEAWLDHGEWQLLDRLALAGKLTQVFTQPWQNRVRSTQAERRAEQLWSERLGPHYPRAHELREWLRRNPQAREILAYINQVRDDIPL
ncbi:MAG: zf-TFIIB domain-containing protein [Rhodanobacteraceae bacterium]|nr:zf-TFIIB domain-containing protein [Rhodanobacteraceae bacterium]